MQQGVRGAHFGDYGQIRDGYRSFREDSRQSAGSSHHRYSFGDWFSAVWIFML